MKILMVGCGRMGRALLENWKCGSDEFFIVDPGLEFAPNDVRLFGDVAQIRGLKFDVVVIAVKPQLIDSVISDYAGSFAPDAYLLSIAAGCSIERLKKASDGQPVVRVMPNLPAAIGAGFSGLCASPDVVEAQLLHAIELMKRAGSVVVVDDEDALDRFTAIAGSGPGYVFEILRAYVKAATNLGFAEELATTMVLETLKGSIALAQQSQLSLEELRNSVTSQDGTTAAGLRVLNSRGELNELFAKTLNAAYDRAIKLRGA